jgi:hypothetical protein
MCNRHSQADEVTLHSSSCRNSSEIAGIAFALYCMKQIARMVLSLTRGEIAEIKTHGKQTANGRQQTA